MDKLKVLIAEDNPRVASNLESILQEDEEITVTGKAEDGLEALEMIQETEPDVLLLDLIMPKLDGLGVLEKMHTDILLKNL